MIKIFNELTEKLAGLNGTAGIVIANLDNEKEYFQYNEEEVFPAASIIKLTIIWRLFQEIDKGKIGLRDKVKLKADVKVGGFGILKELHNGIILNIEDLATLMIVLSDNTATNILIDLLGMERINESIKKMNLKGTFLQRKMMDLEAKKEGFDNFITPRAVYKILRAYLTADNLDPVHCEKIIDIFKRQQCNNKLPVRVPSEIEIAHKTGDLPGVEHDAGIMYINGQRIIVVVLTKELTDNKVGVKLNNQVGEMVYRYYS